MNKKPKILIVDDHVENLIALEVTLGEMDAELIRASSGNEALALTLDHEFALAIMDVQMPGMDGYEAVSLMRQDEATRHLPVIFLSAIYSSDYYKIKGIEVGAVDFITKPFPPEVLAGKVRIFLDLYRQQRALELEISARKRSELELEAHRDHLSELVEEGIREKSKLEAQLQISRRLESIGTLAGGVAHDFNNLLMGIDGYVYLLRHAIHPEGAQEQMEGISQCVESAARLTRRLLAFARKEPIAPEKLNLNHTISQMHKLLSRLIGEDIDLLCTPAKQLYPVKLDPGQVDQILTNLCVNARDAIGGVGQIHISTANRELSADADINPGSYVEIAVTDTGCGMDEETQQRIFEPFFTSKEVGKGTGLGLSTVYGIVKQNHGTIRVESELGQGTTFRIFLPRCEEEDAAQRETLQAIITGTEKILLVEDDPKVREISRAYLVRLGYTVLSVDHPANALPLLEDHPDIALLLSDVVMPGMSGRELAEKVSERLPMVKTLFMSGYTDDIIARHGIATDGSHLLNKPFSCDKLAHTLRKILDG